MPYISSIERLAMAEGEAKGREAGLLEGIALDLETKFGTAARKLKAKAKRLRDIAALRRLARVIKSAQSVAEVLEHLP